jgi:UDP-N-acetylmuramate: L-alanyl-gamma-D-glutamyl-meso-diaminopimelate ligase
VPIKTGIAALAQFKNVKRRMELCGVVNGITVYDDFAHHPTAIQTTLEGLRSKVNGARIVAVLEPRSNTMKMGTWKDSLAGSLKLANLIFCYTDNLGWDVQEALQLLNISTVSSDNLDQLVAAITLATRPGDHILIMSNGGFGGIHKKLLKSLGESHQS